MPAGDRVLVTKRDASLKELKEKARGPRSLGIQLTSFLVWLESGPPGWGRFLLLSWGTLGGRCGQEVGGPGVQPSLSAVLPVLLGGLELLRNGESWKNKWVKRGKQLIYFQAMH